MAQTTGLTPTAVPGTFAVATRVYGPPGTSRKRSVQPGCEQPMCHMPLHRSGLPPGTIVHTKELTWKSTTGVPLAVQIWLPEPVPVMLFLLPVFDQQSPIPHP